jgi:hypothetical protein
MNLSEQEMQAFRSLMSFLTSRTAQEANIPIPVLKEANIPIPVLTPPPAPAPAAATSTPFVMTPGSTTPSKGEVEEVEGPLVMTGALAKKRKRRACTVCGVQGHDKGHIACPFHTEKLPFNHRNITGVRVTREEIMCMDGKKLGKMVVSINFVCDSLHSEDAGDNYSADEDEVCREAKRQK